MATDRSTQFIKGLTIAVLTLNLLLTSANLYGMHRKKKEKNKKKNCNCKGH